MKRRHFLKTTASALGLTWGWGHCLQSSSFGAEAVAPSQPPGRTLLLVDDFHVSYRPKTKRVLHPLKRHPGNPILAGRVKPWEVAIGYTSAYRNPQTGLYQLWYQSAAFGATGDKTRLCTLCYAESNDGLIWTRPELDLYPFNEIKKTNILVPANGGRSSRYGASVVVDPLAVDPARRYKMAYFDFSKEGGHEYPGLSVAFSPDGIHWTKHPQAPLLKSAYFDTGDLVPFHDEPGREWLVPNAVSDVIDAFYDSRIGAFVIQCKMWIDGADGTMGWKRAVGRTQSVDFIHWSQPELVMAPDEFDPPGVELHSAPAFLHHDCYFGLVEVWDSSRQGKVEIELALSRDGWHWQRPFRAGHFLTLNEGDRFDSGCVIPNATPVFLEDEIRFYFGAYNQGMGGSDDTKLTTGVGLYTMPRDRFAGLRPIEKTGQITFHAVDLGGSQALLVNADASGGSLRVELLDFDGHRVRGFTKEDAVPIRGDSLRHPARWKSRELASLEPGRYRLRLHLDNAEVFAITLA